VQPHLGKIFEGISRLDISLEADQVQGMQSSLGELVPFTNPVSTQQAEEAFEEGTEKPGERFRVRRIEEWLVDVESEMRSSLRDQLRRAQLESNDCKRSEWLFKWPAQLVLSLDQCRWT
jgi:dynein heavy chain